MSELMRNDSCLTPCRRSSKAARVEFGTLNALQPVILAKQRHKILNFLSFDFYDETNGNADLLQTPAGAAGRKVSKSLLMLMS